MRYLKQSTAATITLGPFLDDTDGKTAETALTISQADVRLRKNGGTVAQKNDTASCTHTENGYYDCALNTTDTNTLGHLRVAVSESGALPVWDDFTILAANVYDSLIGGGDLLDVNTSELGGSSQNVTDAKQLLDLYDNSVARLFIDINHVQGNVVGKVLGGGVGTIGGVGVWAADGSGNAVAPASATTTIASYLDTEIAAIKAKTDNLPASPAAVGSAMTLTSGERNSVADALLDRADAVETGVTFRNAMRGFVATLLGKSSDDGNTFRNIGDTKNVIAATVDADNNRTAVTRDLT